VHLPLNVLPEQVLQIQQVALADDQPSSVQYDQAALQWTLETAAAQQKQNVISSTGENALQSITPKLNEPLHIELMDDGSMLPNGEQQNQRFIAASESEILGPPLPRVCMPVPVIHSNVLWCCIKCNFYYSRLCCKTTVSSISY